MKKSNDAGLVMVIVFMFVIGLIVGVFFQGFSHGPDPNLKQIRIESYEKGFSDHADAIMEWRSKAPICNMWFIASIEDCKEEEKISNLVLETMFTTKKYQYEFVDVEKGDN